MRIARQYEEGRDRSTIGNNIKYFIVIVDKMITPHSLVVSEKYIIDDQTIPKFIFLPYSKPQWLKHCGAKLCVISGWVTFTRVRHSFNSKALASIFIRG